MLMPQEQVASGQSSLADSSRATYSLRDLPPIRTPELEDETVSRKRFRGYKVKK